MEWIFLIAGPLLLVCGILNFFSRARFKKESTVVAGTVTAIQKGPASKNRTAYYPVIKYVDRSTSAEETFASNTAFEQSRYKVGDSVEVRYLNRGERKQASLNNWFGVWGLAFMLVLFGVIFSAISVVMTVLKK
jgi:hypothetical protein